MKTTFRIIACSLVVLFSLQLTAQTKIIDKSSRKKPNWLKEQIEGYLRINVQKTTLQEAQDAAMDRIKEMIAQSVAQNIISDEFSKVSENEENGESEVSKAYFSFTKTHSARLPFIKGITLSKAKDVYWQEVKHKKTKRIYFNYYLLYPYSKLDQDKLIYQFDQLNKEMKTQLIELEEKQYKMNSVSEIGDCIRKVATLKEFFFDKVNRQRLSGLDAAFKEMYGLISITGAFKSSNEYVCQLMLNGRPIAAERLPRFRANCASKITLHQEGTEICVNYSTVDCLAMEENYIDLNFIIAGKKISHRFYVVSENELALDLIPEGTALLFADSLSTEDITDLTLKISVNNMNGTSFLLKGADFYMPDLVSPISISNLSLAYQDKGTLTFEFLAKGTWKLNKGIENAIRFIKGAFEVKDERTGHSKRVLVNLPYKVNW
jgi:hypothetical protein